MTSKPNSNLTTRTSEVLSGILTSNPEVETFSVERILAAIGNERFEASLMMFSLPAIVPVPSPNGMVALPTGAIAYQLVVGEKQINLPPFILTKSVSRRSLAVAIHAILPVLEAAERIVRPRWSWVTHPVARRAIGFLVFLLAIAIAYPLAGFSTLHAMSIFVVSLGLAEQDGLAILIGVVAGVLSLAVLAASGVSARALRAKVIKSLRKLCKKFGLTALSNFLERLGYPQLARVVAINWSWSEVLMLWDPEKRVAAPPGQTSHPDRPQALLRTDVSGARAGLTEGDPPEPGALLLPRVDLRDEPAQLTRVTDVYHSRAEVGE